MFSKKEIIYTSFEISFRAGVSVSSWTRHFHALLEHVKVRFWRHQGGEEKRKKIRKMSKGGEEFEIIYLHLKL